MAQSVSAPFNVSVIAATGLAPFTLVAPSGGGPNVPVTIGMPLKAGNVPGGQSLRVAGVTSQAIVKNRWPDGSAKFAIVSLLPTLTSGTPANFGCELAASAGQSPLTLSQLRSSGIAAQVDWTPQGSSGRTVRLQDLFADSGAMYEQHIAGPVMSSWTFWNLFPGESDVSAWFEIRYYGGTRAEVLCWLENGWMQSSSPATRDGRVVLTVQGSVRYDSDANAHYRGSSGAPALQPAGTPFRLCHRTAPVLAAGNWITHRTDDSPHVWVRHDPRYLKSTKLVPNYAVATTKWDYESSVPTSYAPNFTNDSSGLYSGSGNRSYGLLHDCYALVVTRGSELDYRRALYWACAQGSYSINLRDQTTKRPIRASQWPNAWYNSSVARPAAGESVPATLHGTFYLSDYHQPSGAAFAYWIAGWNYLSERQQFLASFNYVIAHPSGELNTPEEGRGGAKGIFKGAERSIAWKTRNLALAAVCSPDPALVENADSGAMQGEYCAMLGYNAEYYYRSLVSGEYWGRKYVNNLGHPFPQYATNSHSAYVYGLQTPSGNRLWSGTDWWTNYLTMVHGFVWDLAPNLTVQQRTQLQGVRDHYYKFATRSANGWNYRYLQPYSSFFGRSTAIPESPANVEMAGRFDTWFANWGEAFTAFAVDLPEIRSRDAFHRYAALAGLSSAPGQRLVSVDSQGGQTVELDGSQVVQTYHQEAMASLAYARDHGAPGANQAWSLVSSSPTYQDGLTRGFAANPRWAIAPR